MLAIILLLLTFGVMGLLFFISALIYFILFEPPQGQTLKEFLKELL